MIKDCIAVLELDSTNLTFIIGERSVNGAFAFRYKEKINTYTFFDGEFCNVGELEKLIMKIFEKVYKTQNVKSIEKVYVSVKGEFTKTISKNFRITFNNIKKITTSDILNLFELAYVKLDNYTLINKTAVYYQVGNLKTHSPVGKKGDSLSARLGYIYVNNDYKNVIDKIFRTIGVEKVYYVSSLYAKCNTLYTQSERDNTVMLIDVGETSTELAIVSGNGILYSDAFSLGSEIISAHLSNELNVDYEICVALTKMLNLGYVENADACYVLDDANLGEHTFSRDKVNQIAKNVLEEIAEKIFNSTSKCTLKVPSDIKISFTGNGICEIRGAIEYLASRLSTYPLIIKPTVPHYNKPKYAGVISLIDTALTYCNDKVFFHN